MNCLRIAGHVCRKSCHALIEFFAGRYAEHTMDGDVVVLI